MKIQTTYLPYLPMSARVLLLLGLALGTHSVDASAPQREPFSLDRVVKPGCQGYAEFQAVQARLDGLNAKIAHAVKMVNNENYVALIEEKAQFEDRYKKALETRAKAYFYPREMLWYYFATIRPDELKLLAHDTTHGTVFGCLDTGVSLSSLNLRNPLTHLVSMGQIDNICGFGAAANAAAISLQHAQGQLITSADTRKYAEMGVSKTLDTLIKDVLKRSVAGYAEQDDIIKAMQLLTVPEDTYEIFHTAEANVGLYERIEKKEVYHIIGNVGGGHWAVVSVIKHLDTYSMYVLNSSNAALRNGDAIVTLIRHVDEMIQRIYLREALQAQDVALFNAALANPRVSHSLLLNELVESYASVEEVDKALLEEKIAACAVQPMVESRDLSVDSLKFLLEQAGRNDRIWSSQFMSFTDALKRDSRMGKKTDPKSHDSKNSTVTPVGNRAIVIGALIAGIVSYALVTWFKKKPTTQKTYPQTALIN